MSSVKSAIDRYMARIRSRSLLSDEEFAAISRMVESGEMQDVEGDFVQPGSQNETACLVVEGLVGRFAQQPDGARHIVALHIPGDMADLHSTVASTITWALRAMTPGKILRVRHERILEVANRYPAVAVAFWRDCVVDMTIISQSVVNIARKDAMARVAHILCEMMLRYRVNGDVSGNRFPFPITQADMADALGLTPIHLNRVLQRLKEEGLATKDRGTVTIHDWDQLVEIATFDPGYLQLEQMAVR